MIGIDFYNTWITISSECRKFYLSVRFFSQGAGGGGGGGACWSVLYRCVKKKKTMRKDISIKLESAHHLGYENAFFYGKGAWFSQFCENAVNKGLK